MYMKFRAFSKKKVSILRSKRRYFLDFLLLFAEISTEPLLLSFLVNSR